MREEIAALADQIWRGEEAKEKLHALIRANPGDPGPTEVSELTDFYYRPEYVSRIANGRLKAPKRLKRRRRVAAS